MNEDPNVTRLDTPFKKPTPEGRYLVAVVRECSHWNGPFKIDEKEATVECGRCGTKLNPMFVLQQMLNTENQWHSLFARYQDEMRRLNERSRTKCEHCGQMTRISGR